MLSWVPAIQLSIAFLSYQPFFLSFNDGLLHSHWNDTLILISMIEAQRLFQTDPVGWTCMSCSSPSSGCTVQRTTASPTSIQSTLASLIGRLYTSARIQTLLTREGGAVRITIAAHVTAVLQTWLGACTSFPPQLPPPFVSCCGTRLAIFRITFALTKSIFDSRLRWLQMQCHGAVAAPDSALGC